MGTTVACEQVRLEEEGRVEELEGPTAVETGAASGIGPAVTEVFLGVGTTVVMADVREGPLREQADRLLQGAPRRS